MNRTRFLISVFHRKLKYPGCFLLITVQLLVSRCAEVYDINPAAPRPTISTINPPCGRSGDTVVVTGRNFGGLVDNLTVKVNNLGATVLYASDTSVAIIVPSGASSGTLSIEKSESTAAGPQFQFIPTGKVSNFLDDIFFPGALAADSKGNIYLAESTSNWILKVTPDGQASVLAGDGTAGYRDGDGRYARFNYPYALAVDSHDNIYVSDNKNSAIRKITPAGDVSLYAGYLYDLRDIQLPLSGYYDSVRTASLFKWPTGIAIDQNDNLYIADQGNSRIRKVTPDAGMESGRTTTLAGNGETGNKDGAALEASFNYPNFLAVDALGNIYLTDYSGVREISSTNVVRTILSNGIEYEDCRGNVVRPDGATGIAIDSLGYIYINVLENDSNYRVLTISPDNSVSTLAGGADPGPNNEENEEEGFKAAFGYLNGLVMSGNVLYATSSYKIRKIEIK